MNWQNGRRAAAALAAPLGIYLFLICFGAAGPAHGAQKPRTRNLILVTADGLRWQEVFRGIDPALMKQKAAGMEEAEELRQSLWADTPEERRRKLMPFLWSEVARNGLILGNRDAHSDMKVSNGIRVSYPGYSEILTGHAQDDLVHGNDPIQNPSVTILEFLRRKWNLPIEKAALIGSWETFQKIGEHEAGTVFINAGFQRLEHARYSKRLRELSAMQFDLVTAWASVRHDYITFEMAREYLRTKKPRILHIALGETDDWAHDKRYDLTLKTAAYFDRCLAELWKLLQNEGFYRGKTTLVISSDHGRGSTLADWTSHGTKVDGAEFIWAAFLGPDTPATGEAHDTDTYYQRDIAPTMLDLAGIDYSEMEGVQGRPIPIAIAGN